MKIVRTEAWAVEMALAEPYDIAYQSQTAAINVFLRIETNTGLIGLGCAAPEPAVTGEDPAGVEADLRDVAGLILRGLDPLRRMRLIGLLRESGLGDSPSALAAVDVALADLMGRAARQPLWKLLGGFRDRIKTSVTIGIMPVDDALARAGEMIRRGFSCLKIKGGVDLEADVERVLKLREACGRDIELRFDANRGYGVEQSLQFVHRTAAAGLTVLEQPTESSRQLGRVTNRTSMPIMADESLLTLGDAFRLATEGLVDMINVKLTKVGGLSEALHIEAVARAAGLEVMVGCMDESALGIAAGLAFALARPTVRYADLDGHLDLVGDPFAGRVRLENGFLFGTDRPGLGVGP